MIRIFSFLAGLLAVLAATAPANADPKALVELFTSQGCSSCVAADAYFADLAKRKDVVAISLHVDYWDYLGWRDTLGDSAYSARQRDYAAAQGSRRVYTPQIVVNGVDGFVGSDRRSVSAAIARGNLRVPVTIRHGDGTVEIEVGALPNQTKKATIRLVLLTSEAKVAIARGENAGRDIEYYNVVRGMRPVGMWGGDPVKITLPGNEIMGRGIDACAIIVQEDLAHGPGRIVGAALLDNW